MASESAFRILALASRAFATADIELSALLARIARYTADAIGDVCAIRFLDDDRKFLDLVALERKQPEGAGLVPEWFARTRVQADDLGGAAETGALDVLTVPLRTGENIVGNIALSRTSPWWPYTIDDQGLLEELADRAGIAIRGARLHQELKLALQTRDDFLATAGHELKTPLAAMLMHVQSLQRVTRRDPTANVVDRIDKIANSGLRLERLVRQLLDVSMITAGKIRLEPDPFDLMDLVGDVVARFVEASDGVSTPISVRGETRVDGCWDWSRIDQVITNLVANGMKYGKGKPVAIDVSVDEGDVIIRVIDQGIGIDTEHQKKLFERFERAAATREFSGFGLGLWIARQIVEASGGRVVLESTSTDGSVFNVRLPRWPSNETIGEVSHGAV
jgi:signal transduction histidine kinase